MGLHQDSVYPLCQEEEDTTAYFNAQCSALMLLWKNILGDFILSLDTLSNIHWLLFLKLKLLRGFTDLVVCRRCALGRAVASALGACLCRQPPRR